MPPALLGDVAPASSANSVLLLVVGGLAIFAAVGLLVLAVSKSRAGAASRNVLIAAVVTGVVGLLLVAVGVLTRAPSNVRPRPPIPTATTSRDTSTTG